jgi:uncharacterized protein YjbI with pentapeptide repeats
MQQDARQQKLADQRAQQAQKLENQRAAAERKLAEQRAQDEALQAYLDQMSTLLLEKDLRSSEADSEVRTLARARTATVIQRLDADGNRNVIRFLKEANLTGNGQPLNKKGASPVGDGRSSMSLLAGADLQGAHLEGVDLSRLDLSGSILSDSILNSTDLSGADLSEADLSDALLRKTNLGLADLSGANLEGADLYEAYLNDAYLAGADLYEAYLHGANLSDANLVWAYLRKANLEDATIIAADLSLANLNIASLENADLGAADLNGANLEGADLSGADLFVADLSGHLSRGDLGGTALTRTILSEADLSNAVLRYAVLRTARGVTKEGLEQQTDSLEGTIMPDGTIHPGRYAARKFEPALSFFVSDGWRLSDLEETTDVLIIEGPEGGKLAFTSPRHVYDPSNPSEPKEVPAPENADEWASWFQSHPNLDTSEPVLASVGGRYGVQIDVTDLSTPENYPQDVCRQEPCVPVYRVSATESTIGGYEGFKDRFVIVDVGGETAILDVTAPTDRFADFLPKAQKVLDTVEWKGG